MDAQELATLVGELRLVGTDQQAVEVKSGVGKSIRDTLSAFSNSGGGTLIVGLSEKDGFTPVPGFDAVAARDRLTSRCDQMTPLVRPDIDVLPFEGQSVVVALIPEMEPRYKPCFIADQGVYQGSYVRTGDGDRQMKRYEVDRCIEEHSQPRWDEEIVTEAGLSDLDQDILGSFLDRQRAARQRTFSDGDEIALERLRVLKDGHPTLAALLAMGVYPQEFFPRLTVSFAVFPGTDRGDVGKGVRLLDSRTFSGPIPELVESSVEAVRNNMRTAALVGDTFRTELPDYPLVAVREAVVNALMHRDYSPDARGSQVQVSMFVDRLEIKNPGGLYGPVTVDTLGEAGMSASRNQRLSTMLETTSFPGGGIVAENRGTGIAVIRNELAHSLLPPPEMRDSLTDFTVVFRRRRVASQERYASATDRVRDYLEHHETASSSDLMAQTGLSRSAIHNAIRTLVDGGEAEAMEPARSPKQRYRMVRRGRR